MNLLLVRRLLGGAAAATAIGATSLFFGKDICWAAESKKDTRGLTPECHKLKSESSASAKSWPGHNPGGDRRVFKNSGGEIKSVDAVFNYQKRSEVGASLVRDRENMKLGMKRNTSGGDGELIGVDWAPTQVHVQSARHLTPSLAVNGFELCPHDMGKEFDYYCNEMILTQYYPSVCELVQQVTGASHVFAFDHNIRCASGNDEGRRLKGGSAVQRPAHLVHTDYTLTSAPARLRQLGSPAKVNDTWKSLRKEGEPLIPPELVERAISEGRYALINVWRNICQEPVQRFPLAICSADSFQPDDLAVFEIHYVDRIGENYFVRQPAVQDSHQWYYYPHMEIGEALVFKQWDSRGALQADGTISPAVDRQVPQFCFHSSFDDPSTVPGAPDRESIECRVMVLFLDEAEHTAEKSN